MCMVGLKRMIEAWNSHSIPKSKQTIPVDISDIPSFDEAVSAYREQGGTSTDPTDFGVDPLTSNCGLQHNYS